LHNREDFDKDILAIKLKRFRELIEFRLNIQFDRYFLKSLDKEDC